jgi:hypothetical protein
MRGICVNFDNPNIRTIWPDRTAGATLEQNVVPFAGGSRFAHYFEPLDSIMGDLFWFAHCWQSSPFVDLIFEPGGEECLNRYQVDHPRFDDTSASLFCPGCLPRLAQWLRDDWIDLLGYTSGDANAGEIADELFDAHQRGEEAYYGAIEKLVRLCFFCVDGMWWEFYSKDQTAVSRVFERVSGIEGVSVRSLGLLDRGRHNK